MCFRIKILRTKKLFLFARRLNACKQVLFCEIEKQRKIRISLFMTSSVIWYAVKTTLKIHFVFLTVFQFLYRDSTYDSQPLLARYMLNSHSSPRRRSKNMLCRLTPFIFLSFFWILRNSIYKLVAAGCFAFLRLYLPLRQETKNFQIIRWKLFFNGASFVSPAKHGLQEPL